MAWRTEPSPRPGQVQISAVLRRRLGDNISWQIHIRDDDSVELNQLVDEDGELRVRVFDVQRGTDESTNPEKNLRFAIRVQERRCNFTLRISGLHFIAIHRVIQARNEDTVG